MRVVVLQELTAEVALQEQAVGVRDERQANAGRAPDDWHITRVDPADAHALAVGLGLKADHPGTEVALMHLGPADAVHWMREEAARGCDAAVRVWDDELALAGTQAKALVLAAAVRSHGADLVLTGTANAASAGGQLGVLLGAAPGRPLCDQRLARRVPPLTKGRRQTRPRRRCTSRGTSPEAIASASRWLFPPW